MLHDVNLEIAPGESVAFVGPTGAGKSTMAKLANRFYDPTVGSRARRRHRRQDGDPALAALAARRRAPGAVPLRRLDPHQPELRPPHAPPTTRSTTAVDVVGLRELVDRLPEGLDTPVHERGQTLSAGERQQLALARAFLARPRVLILDEATSSLDLQSETVIERALDRLLEGRSAILIAHRLTTAQRADRIVVIDDGGIVEMGTPEELLAAGRRLRRHVRGVARLGRT